MRGLSLTDAVTITGATSGTTLAIQSVTIGPLTNPQKTALMNFLNTLGLPGNPSHIVEINLMRQSGALNNLLCVVSGLVQPASASAALQNRTTYDDIVGVVP